jgi:hypothetical protein
MYQHATAVGLVLTSLPGVAGVYMYYRTPYRKTAFNLLLLSAFLIRLLMISLDPFLQDWDERFHAIVAKNMMDFPFKPMMVVNPVFAQLRIGGTVISGCTSNRCLCGRGLLKYLCNTVAMRLPIAIWAIAIWMIRDIANRWTRNDEIAFIVHSLLVWIGNGGSDMSLDHNDFTFTLHCGTWAWSRYGIQP